MIYFLNSHLNQRLIVFFIQMDEFLEFWRWGWHWKFVPQENDRKSVCLNAYFKGGNSIKMYNVITDPQFWNFAWGSPLYDIRRHIRKFELQKVKNGTKIKFTLSHMATNIQFYTANTRLIEIIVREPRSLWDKCVSGRLESI